MNRDKLALNQAKNFKPLQIALEDELDLLHKAPKMFALTKEGFLSLVSHILSLSEYDKEDDEHYKYHVRPSNKIWKFSELHDSSLKEEFDNDWAIEVIAWAKNQFNEAQMQRHQDKLNMCYAFWNEVYDCPSDYPPIDKMFDCIDDVQMLSNGAEVVDYLIQTANIEKLSSQLIVGLLCMTNRNKENFPSRKKFFQDCKSYFLSYLTPEEVDKKLVNLQ